MMVMMVQRWEGEEVKGRKEEGREEKSEGRKVNKQGRVVSCGHAAAWAAAGTQDETRGHLWTAILMEKVIVLGFMSAVR